MVIQSTFTFKIDRMIELEHIVHGAVASPKITKALTVWLCTNGNQQII
jgi:hypothetical protein